MPGDRRASARAAPRSPRASSRAAAARGSAPGGRRCRRAGSRRRAAARRGASPARARRRRSRSGRRRARCRGSCGRAPRKVASSRAISVGCLAAVGQRPQLDRHASGGLLRRSHARPCGRASAPGSPRAPRGESTSPRLSCGGANSSQPGGRTPRRFASTPIDRARLHLADAGQREQAPLEVGAVAARPSRRAAASPPYSLAIARADAPARAGPCWPGSGAAPASPGRPPRARPDPSPRSASASSPPSRCDELERRGERLLHGHLLVEHEADQQRERALDRGTRRPRGRR